MNANDILKEVADNFYGPYISTSVRKLEAPH